MTLLTSLTHFTCSLKVMLLRRVLSRYEWVHWVDLDTLFMNMKRSPMEFLDASYAMPTYGLPLSS